MCNSVSVTEWLIIKLTMFVEFFKSLFDLICDLGVTTVAALTCSFETDFRALARSIN